MRNEKMEKLFDILGEILAVLLVIAYVLDLANAQWMFLPNPIVNIINIAKMYGALLLVGIVGLEAMSKRAFILRVIFYCMLAIIVIFLFFPGTYAYLIGMIPQA